MRRNRSVHTSPRRWQRLLPIGIATLFLFALQQASHAEVSQEDADDVIFNRQLIMTQLEQDTELLGQILAGVASKEKLAEVTRAIAKGAKDAENSFLSKVPGGRTKSTAWDGSDFSERMSSFAANAEALANVAETGNLSAVSEMVGSALPCKQCHDLYVGDLPHRGSDLVETARRIDEHLRRALPSGGARAHTRRLRCGGYAMRRSRRGLGEGRNRRAQEGRGNEQDAHGHSPRSWDQLTAWT